VIITEGNLEVVAEGPSLVIHHPDAVLDAMNEWCVEHHGQSGLTKAVKESKVREGGKTRLLLTCKHI
jgi:oligoribonuclease